MVDLLLQLVLLALELPVGVLDEIILRSVSGLRKENRPPVAHRLVLEEVELVSEATVPIGGVREPRLYRMDHVCLPFGQAEGNLAAEVPLLPLEQIEDEGNFGIGGFEVELSNSVEGAIAVQDCHL